MSDAGKGMRPKQGYNPKAYRSNWSAVFKPKPKPRKKP